jgi:hypothetical protein
LGANLAEQVAGETVHVACQIDASLASRRVAAMNEKATTSKSLGGSEGMDGNAGDCPSWSASQSYAKS